jgi:hypothetical protein
MTMFWSFRYYPHLLSEALQARVHEAQARPFYRATDTEELVLRNAATGEVLKKVNSPHAIRVSRAGLRKLLLDGLDVKVREGGPWLLIHIRGREKIKAN